MSTVKFSVVCCDNVCVDVEYSSNLQRIIQQKATHFMITHNSLVFVVPYPFDTFITYNINYRVNLTGFSHRIVEKLIMTEQIKSILTNHANLCIFHMTHWHPGTKFEFINIVDNDY
jgi:hypothetical protein